MRRSRGEGCDGAGDVSKPTPISGFPEWLPAERIVEQQVLDILREVFELHGFASVQTRAVEPLEQLLRKGETSKEVYTLRRLQADAAEDSGDQASALGLHFDLTVPFARYVLENAGHLQFPFRRYQIQPAWRGERPQEGRYREFVQADVDIVDRDTLSVHHEVEIAQVMADVFGRLPLPPVRMQVNNRRLIEGYYRGLGIVEVEAVMRVVDKLDKIGRAGVEKAMVDDLGASTEQARGALALAEITGDHATIAEQVAALGVTHPLLDEGLAVLVSVLEGTAALRSDTFTVVADLAIARGLDYYTGTVFETRMQGFEHVGSICSGGRYDSLATDGRTTYPGVGISLGVTRTLAPLFSRGLLTASRSTPTAVLVALPSEEERAACTAVASALRRRGIATEVSPTASKYGKQIRYAERRGIPFVWFPQPDGSHQVRDIRSAEQAAADPASWAPPDADLRPATTRTAAAAAD
ncbi:MAG: histidyl-tRNA synthetase [Actinomycetota bacterium]|jgi:histidyl-tRNA synthetase|nr:histidyl-tRNA synthetase [Actinomycetota bacterium]